MSGSDGASGTTGRLAPPSAPADEGSPAPLADVPRQAAGTLRGADTRVFRSPFPPIADYAFLSDREVNALVAPSGNVEWMCLPRPDSPSVFGSILDRAAGGFRLGPADVMVPAGRRDPPRSTVLGTARRTPTRGAAR